MKKLLIIGAGYLQSFVIKKAKEMGYYTIAIDKNPNSIGFSIANEHEVVDIVDQEACLSFARKMCIDGVLTAATDYGVLTTAYVAQQMNLPGLKYEIAKIIKNKYIIRHILSEKHIDDISQYYEISNNEDLDRIKSQIRFPVIVKPCDGSGSKSVKRVNNIKDLVIACNEAINTSLIKKALVEDFIIGKEYGVESFVCDGQVYILGVMGKKMTKPPYYAELGHSIPIQLDIEQKIKEVAYKAIKTLGINFGAVNMDILVTNDNQVSIVDIGARMGGNLIGSHIIPLGTGIDYMGNLIRASVGDSIDLRPRVSKSCVVTRLLALSPGEVEKLPDFKQISNMFQVDIYHHLEVGSIIKEYHNNLDGWGYIVASSNNIMDAEKRSEEALKLINKSIIRKI